MQLNHDCAKAKWCESLPALHWRKAIATWSWFTLPLQCRQSLAGKPPLERHLWHCRPQNAVNWSTLGKRAAGFSPNTSQVSSKNHHFIKATSVKIKARVMQIISCPMKHLNPHSNISFCNDLSAIKPSHHLYPNVLDSESLSYEELRCNWAQDMLAQTFLWKHTCSPWQNRLVGAEAPQKLDTLTLMRPIHGNL